MTKSTSKACLTLREGWVPSISLQHFVALRMEVDGWAEVLIFCRCKTYIFQVTLSCTICSRYNSWTSYCDWQQLRRHGDIFQRFPGGFYKAHGRSDDTMNLGGIKVRLWLYRSTNLQFSYVLPRVAYMKAILFIYVSMWAITRERKETTDSNQQTGDRPLKFNPWWTFSIGIVV